MANLNETSQWEDGVYQIETSDPVIGGPAGIANKQAEQLSNRTVWLKQQVEASGINLSEHITNADPHPQYVNHAELSEISFEQVNADWAATAGAAQILNKPVLSEVALSGSYDDLEGKPQDLATMKDIAILQEEIAKKGAPVGSGIDHYGTTPPAHYLVCDGSAISRVAYPELYAVIGTRYGAGDGSTTFNLPNLINRFAQGSNTPGQYIAAGLPNITGGLGFQGGGGVRENYGAFCTNGSGLTYVHSTSTIGATFAEFSAQRSNPTYGASGTVQPPALTVLPCIKYE